MKIFAMDDHIRTINSIDYKKACMNYKFNMLENRLVKFSKTVQHILWTDIKVAQWKKERPKEHSSEQYNNWLEEKFQQYKKGLKN